MSSLVRQRRTAPGGTGAGDGPTRVLSPSTARAFLQEPVGRVVKNSAGYMVWCSDPSLCGAAYWGRPAASRALWELLGIDGHPRLARPVDVLTDTRCVRDLDESAFRALAGYVRNRLPELACNVRRHAVVHDAADSVAVHAIAGFYARIRPGFMWRTFEDVGSALRWLGRKDSLASELELLTVEATRPRPLLLDRLDALLRDSHRRSMSRGDAAARLGASDWTLRRTLAEAGTSYRGEVERSRIVRAMTMLVRSDAEIDAVALGAGFGSRSQFHRAFRRVTGVSPGQYRRRNEGRS